jgi:basic membrane protein A and related proteins
MTSTELWRQAAGLLVSAFFFITATGCQPPPALDCRSSEITCVGLVTDVDGLADAGLNEQAWAVLASMRSEDLVANYIESVETSDYAKNLAYFADHGYDFVIASGYSVSEHALSMAGDYPDISFVMLGRAPDEQDVPPNLAGVVFPEEVAGFWAGAIAAHYSQTGIVGAVFAHPALPPVVAYSGGFTTATQDIQSNIVYLESHRFADTLINPDWGAEQALALEEQGTDVLFAYGGATGLAALEQAGSQIIGVETDLARRYPHFKARVLASILFDPSVLREIILSGKINQPVYRAGYTIAWGETAPPASLIEILGNVPTIEYLEIPLPEDAFDDE